MKKALLLIILLIFLVSPVYAYEYLGIITNPRPTITVEYNNEPNGVTITATRLQDSSNNNYNLALISNQNNIKFQYKPTENLVDNRNYTFSITAEDYLGNGQTTTYMFYLKIASLNIMIVKPRFGYSNITLFDLELSTTRDAICKYAFTPGYDFSLANNFDATNGVVHRKNSFTLSSSHLRMFVLCNDTLGIFEESPIDLYLDTAFPTITNVQINDITKAPIKTTLKMDMDEPTVCNYYLNDNTKDFSNMIKVNNYNENDISYYKTHQEQNITTDLIDYQTNYVYVICKDRAGLLSSKYEKSFWVNTNQSPTLTINSPQPNSYLSTSTVNVDLSTNKAAQCNYDTSEKPTHNDYIYVMTDSSEGTRHIASRSLSLGTYTYYFSCLLSLEGSQLKASVTFTIDTTKPVILLVKHTSPLGNVSKTYSDSKLCGYFRANDSESGVDEFNYTIKTKTGNNITDRGILDSGISEISTGIYQWGDTSYNDDSCIEGLSLRGNVSYVFEVSARNRAGLWSDTKTSDGITIDTSLRPASCYDGTKNGDETDVDCGGSCKTCELNKKCFDNADCKSNYCSVEGICKEPKCNDNAKNGKETDEDCGGSCSGCEVGEDCKTNSDCKSGLKCDSSTKTCVESNSCSNNKIDFGTGETDIDCGGPCLACEDGQDCIENTDCKSLSCSNSKCQTPSCTDKVKNGDESDIDCGDNCNPCNLDQRCFADSDCLTNTCISGRCKESNDDDNDGMPNDWEQIYGFNPKDPSDANQDQDGDGLTNLEEYELGTDPTQKEKGKSNWFVYVLFFIAFVLIAGGIIFAIQKYQKPKKPLLPRVPPLIRRPLRPRPMLPRRPLRPTQPLKPAAPKPVAPAKPTEPEKEWVTLKELKEKKPDVFSRLPTLTTKKGTKDIFKELESIAKGTPSKAKKSSEKAIKELKTVKKKKKR